MRYAVFVVAVLATGCGGGTPTSPSGQAESVTWTVNGTSFTASSNGRGALRGGSSMFLSGTNCAAGAALNIQVPSSATVGSYQIGDNGVNVTWTPDARTGTSANERWSAPSFMRVGGSGSVTISAVSGDWVSGTFSFEVVADLANRDPAPKSLQGAFELSFRERSIC